MWAAGGDNVIHAEDGIAVAVHEMFGYLCEWKDDVLVIEEAPPFTVVRLPP
jgi:hypothetical protein